MLDKKPTKYDVLEQLVEIDAKWCEIGIGLRLNSNYLDGLTQSNVSNTLKLDHVLQKWIQLDGRSSSDGQSPLINWKTIIDVVKGPLVQNKALAIKIYQYLKQHQTLSKYNIFNRHAYTMYNIMAAAHHENGKMMLCIVHRV